MLGVYWDSPFVIIFLFFVVIFVMLLVNAIIGWLSRRRRGKGEH
jgi:hypothetical protein